MLNYIWLILLLVGFVTGLINGRIEEVTQAAVNSSKGAIDLGIGLMGILCLWSGLMAIAEKSGMVDCISRIMRPVLRRLFPDVPANHPAMGAIVMNLAANFFGLGNAATPLGLRAMSELQKLNRHKDTATNSMSMFLVLNTAAIQLVPATIIALRSFAGSENPADIIITIWVASLCSCIAGIFAAKFMSAFNDQRILKKSSILKKRVDY